MSKFSQKIRNGVLLAILGLGLLAIVVTGFGTDGMGGLGGMGGGQRAEALAEIDGEELTDLEVNRQLSLAYRQYAQENPNAADRGRFFGEVFDPLLEQIIDSRTVAAFGRQLGIVVSDGMIDAAIGTDPRFLIGGVYDDNAFRAFLDQFDLSERQARAEIEEQLLIRMIAAPVGGRIRMPPAITRAYADLLLESRTGQIGAVPTEVLARSIQPSDDEVARFYEGNKQLFQQPERRIVRFALIGRDQLGEAARVTDQDIATFYQQNQNRFGPSEARSLLIFTTRDEAVARRFGERVRGGTGFAEAARAEGFAPQDITFSNLRREQVVQQSSEEIANAVFGAAQGGLVGPERTPTGFFKVVRVESITRTPGRPLEAVRGEIVTALETQKLTDALTARDEQLRDRLEGGASLEELAREAGLQVQTTPAITEAGTAPNFQMPAELLPIARAAFEIDANEPDLQDVVPDRQIALVEVTSVLPPAVPPLDQIRDQVRQRLIQRTGAERARAIAEGIVNRINGGMAPDQAYAQAGIALPSRETRTERRANIERIGQQAPPPFRILFAIPEGRARMVAAPNNAGWIIVHHQRRIAGNASTDAEGREALAEMERRLTSSGTLEIVGQFARSIRGIVEVSRDEDRIRALRQSLVNGQ
jgi:peptidyl-prolyl cis-trans isomerase D